MKPSDFESKKEYVEARIKEVIGDEYIFTTGAYIFPMKINGKYMWVVGEFEDDTLCKGTDVILNESSNTLEELVDKESLENEYDDWKDYEEYMERNRL